MAQVVAADARIGEKAAAFALRWCSRPQKHVTLLRDGDTPSGAGLTGLSQAPSVDAWTGSGLSRSCDDAAIAIPRQLAPRFRNRDPEVDTDRLRENYLPSVPGIRNTAMWGRGRHPIS